jgi:hypothetical protein
LADRPPQQFLQCQSRRSVCETPVLSPSLPFSPSRWCPCPTECHISSLLFRPVYWTRDARINFVGSGISSLPSHRNCFCCHCFRLGDQLSGQLRRCGFIHVARPGDDWVKVGCLNRSVFLTKSVNFVSSITLVCMQHGLFGNSNGSRKWTIRQQRENSFDQRINSRFSKVKSH